MNTLTIDGWCKPGDDKKSIPIGKIHFHVDEDSHLRLEQAEERLQDSEEPEIILDVDMTNMELKTSDECGPLSDCSLRVYISTDHRGHFHLIGHRKSDGSLIYTNSVMVDQLG